MPRLFDGPLDSPATFLFAHGAGAGMDHPFMAAMARHIAAQGIRVVRFEFSYMEQRRKTGKKRPPDRMPKLLESYREQVMGLNQEASGQQRLVIGGKSMGGRVATLLAAEEGEALGIDGVICLGFPFHPPGKPDRFRGEHLATIKTSTLILQGERDLFGRRNEVEGYSLSPHVQCRFLADGDHSFVPRKRSGMSLESHQESAAQAMVAFIEGSPSPQSPPTG